MQNRLTPMADVPLNINGNGIDLHPLCAPPEGAVWRWITAADNIDPKRLLRRRSQQISFSVQVVFIGKFLHPSQRALDHFDDGRNLNPGVGAKNRDFLFSSFRRNVEHRIENKRRDHGTVLTAAETDQPGAVIFQVELTQRFLNIPIGSDWHWGHYAELNVACKTILWNLDKLGITAVLTGHFVDAGLPRSTRFVPRVDPLRRTAEAHKPRKGDGRCREPINCECRMRIGEMFRGMGQARNGARTAQRTVPTGEGELQKAECRMQKEEDALRDGTSARRRADGAAHRPYQGAEMQKAECRMQKGEDASRDGTGAQRRADGAAHRPYRGRGNAECGMRIGENIHRSQRPVLRSSTAEGREGGWKGRGFRRRDTDGCDRDGRAPQSSGLQRANSLFEKGRGPKMRLSGSFPPSVAGL